MHGLVTPRAVLAEIRKADSKPWWASRLFDDIEAHLKSVRFKGRWLLDTPMTSAAVEAVLEEAVDVVRKPRSVEQLIEDLRKSVQV